MDDIGLYTATTEDLPKVIRGASSFVKNPDKPTPFHATTFYIRAKMFLGKLSTLFADHRTNSASEFVEFLKNAMPLMRTKSIPGLRMIFSCMYHFNYYPTVEKVA